MAQLRFSSTLMSGTGHTGEMAPDDTGYYDVGLCSFNVHSKMGDFFSMQGVERLFEEQSDLMRRLRNGSLYIENGHPYQTPGMSDGDYYLRIMTIQEDRFCGHIKELYIDWDFGKNNPHLTPSDTVLIRGLVKPYGEHKHVLEDAFRNKCQNLAFSVRGLSDLEESMSGKITRYMTTIVTFDFVGEGAMALADRHTSVSLLSYQPKIIMDRTIDVDVFKDLYEKAYNGKVTLQSNQASILEEIHNNIQRRKEQVSVDNGLYDFLR